MFEGRRALGLHIDSSTLNSVRVCVFYSMCVRRHTYLSLSLKYFPPLLRTLLDAHHRAPAVRNVIGVVMFSQPYHTCFKRTLATHSRRLLPCTGRGIVGKRVVPWRAAPCLPHHPKARYVCVCVCACACACACTPQSNILFKSQSMFQVTSRIILVLVLI